MHVHVWLNYSQKTVCIIIYIYICILIKCAGTDLGYEYREEAVFRDASQSNIIFVILKKQINDMIIF